MQSDKKTRVEHDSLGAVEVPATALWGAQTERSRKNFPIGSEHMPCELISALALIKKAAALVNADLGVLDVNIAKLIAEAADEVIKGDLSDMFPLVVWQTGSGTQTNMNVNEVLAHCVNQRAGKALAHPNDTINKSQSSNDVFPSAIHIAAVLMLKTRLFPAIDALITSCKHLEKNNAGIIKSGRTHLQDAVPIAFSQEISGWRALLENAKTSLEQSLDGLYRLALGGTAVGTGLNAPAGFGSAIAQKISELTGEPFISSPNKFAEMSGKDALVFSHGALKALACNAMKIANDVRWLASGPRLGLGEITIPANEPGSSIMPGKVNPTQCEALTQVALQVMGNDSAITFAASQGNFELNVFMPLIAYNYLQSVRLLADALSSFNLRCMSGIVANEQKMNENVHHSLMLVTCLSPEIGYEKAAEVAKKAYSEKTTLRLAASSLGYLTEERFDELVKPEDMV